MSISSRTNELQANETVQNRFENGKKALTILKKALSHVLHKEQLHHISCIH